VFAVTRYRRELHAAPAPISAASRTRRLRDGTEGWIRLLTPGDRDLIAGGVRRLSARSRYQRFLSGVPESMLRELVDGVDGVRHIALVMFVGETPIGVGRLMRLAGQSDTADIAITVHDAWQGRGAGAVLAEELLACAVDVRRLETVVSADNTASLRLLSRLGTAQVHPSGGTCDVTVDITARPSEQRRQTGRAPGSLRRR